LTIKYKALKTINFTFYHSDWKEKRLKRKLNTLSKISKIKSNVCWKINNQYSARILPKSTKWG